MAHISGDLPKAEQEIAKAFLQIYATVLRDMARTQNVPADALNIFQAPYLLVGRDAESFSFVFANSAAGTHLKFSDFRKQGTIQLESLIRQVNLEIGTVIWGLSIPAPTSSRFDFEQVQSYVIQYLNTLKEVLKNSQTTVSTDALLVPEIAAYVDAFQLDHPQTQATAFIMMQFGTTNAHKEIEETIKAALYKHGILGLRADDKQYADDLFLNIRTYMHCARFGIAVFERLTAENFNPNVSLEVGYMMGLGKNVCLLKDRTLGNLHSDLVGRLYKSFDPQDVRATLPHEIEKWLRDKQLIS